MNEVLYYLALVLMLPIASLAAFGFLIERLSKSGLWTCIKWIFAPLYDPFGRGLWTLVPLLGVLGLCAAGHFPETRPAGLAAIMAAIVFSALYVLRVYPGKWSAGAVFYSVPSVAGLAISAFSLVRPLP